jgi:hypothetical protein
MPEEKKEPLHPEVTFLPPLEMILSSFETDHKRALKKQEDEKKKETEEKSVAKLIEKLEKEK